VHALKFEGRVSVAGTLAHLLLEALEGRGHGHPDLMLPVPLHPARLRARGFNQAAEVARRLGGDVGVAQAPWGVCRRTKATHPQSRLQGGAARARNVRGAFLVDPGLAGSRVAIVDDVMTTGATLFELARALRRVGVAEVQAWVCCRAFRQGG
jgi:ComF family protein